LLASFQNRIKELEEALEQERAAHFRVSNQQFYMYECLVIVKFRYQYSRLHIIIASVNLSLQIIAFPFYCVSENYYFAIFPVF